MPVVELTQEPNPGPSVVPAIDQPAAAAPSPVAVRVSHTGVPLTRDVAYRYALDPTEAQQEEFLRYARAARYAYNHHIGRVKANLDQRRAEVSYGVDPAAMTPSLSWSKVSFINEFNAFKNGQLPTSHKLPG